MKAAIAIISAVILVLETGAQLSRLPRRLRATTDVRTEVLVQNDLYNQPQQEVIVVEQEQRDLKNDQKVDKQGVKVNANKKDAKKNEKKNAKKNEKKNAKKIEQKNKVKNNNPVPSPEMSIPGNICSSLSKQQCKMTDDCVWESGLCFDVPEDLCAPLSKRLCSRYDTCDWDGSTCYGANRRKLVSMEKASVVKDERRLGNNNKKNTSSTQVSCASLGRKKCKNDDTCTWNRDDQLCFADVTPEMSMPLDQCSSLGRRRCKKNEACTWDGSVCFLTPKAEDVCAPLSKKQCKNDASCKWDGVNCSGVNF